MIDGWGYSCEIALIWMSSDFTDDQSTLVQVMAWCRQATSHYLSQCWPRPLSPYGVTRPQWVNMWPYLRYFIVSGRSHVTSWPATLQVVWVLSRKHGGEVGIRTEFHISPVGISWKEKALIHLNLSNESSWVLTHWGWDKMVAILHAMFWNTFSWIKTKMFEFWIKFHWKFFHWVQFTARKHWFR